MLSAALGGPPRESLGGVRSEGLVECRPLVAAALLAAGLLACAEVPVPAEPEPCVLYLPPATPETWELAVRVREGDCMVRMLAPVPPPYAP